MPLDFLKIKIVDDTTIKALWENPLLYFHSKDEILSKDKEIINTKNKKQYNGIIFEPHKDGLYIYFKPHYFFNDNKHNANDFSIENCIKTLIEFTNLFNLNPYHLEIINIEFGVNIIIPYNLICVKELLLHLVFHNRNPFHTDKRYSFTRYSTTTNANGKTNVYKIIKAYAKGIQYPTITDKNTFRFEVKSNRKSYINNLGIISYNDIINKQTYLTLGEHLLKEFDDVLIIDDSVMPKLSNARLKTHQKRFNPITWHRYLQKSQNVFRNNFINYYENLNTCKTHLKKEIRLLLENKLQDLKKSVHI